MSARALWTVDDMAAAMGAGRQGALPQSVSGISIDSRTIAPGEAYFAIKGDVHDGHDFVAAALEAGAGLAVVAKARHEDRGAGRQRLKVPDRRVRPIVDVILQLLRAAHQLDWIDFQDVGQLHRAELLVQLFPAIDAAGDRPAQGAVGRDLGQGFLTIDGNG